MRHMFWMRQFDQSPDGYLHGIPIGTDLDIRQRYNVYCTLPKGAGGAAVEAMVASGTIVGKGASFVFSGDLGGKTFIVTDSRATTTTAKTITFNRSSFANNMQPTAAEIVAALNAVFVADASPTVASVGAKGNIVITGASASATAVLTIGAGTANQLLGFPEDGVVLRIDNAAGVSLILPATYDNQFLHSRAPRVHESNLTAATLVKTYVGGTNPIGWTWTPSTRTLLITDATPTTGVQRQVSLVVEI